MHPLSIHVMQMIKVAMKLQSLLQYFFKSDFVAGQRGRTHRDIAQYSVYHRLKFINSNTKFDCNTRVKDEIVKGQEHTSYGFNFPLWAKWMLGSMVSLLLPFWKQKWEKLQRIEGEAEMVIGEVESVAEVVEKVANVTEQISAQMAEKLPNNGKLKEAVLMVQHVSQITAHDAQSTQNSIHKVDELKQDLDDLETMVDKARL